MEARALPPVRRRGPLHGSALRLRCRAAAVRELPNRSRRPRRVEVRSRRAFAAPPSPDAVGRRKKLAWEKEMSGTAAEHRLARRRLGGWPERLLADKRALPKADLEFLERFAFFFFNDTATPKIYPFSLPDALPI